MKPLNHGPSHYHRANIGEYHRRTTAGHVTGKKQQNRLNQLAKQPGSAHKNRQAAAMLDLLLLIGNINTALAVSQSGKNNHRHGPLALPPARINDDAELICRHDAIRRQPALLRCDPRTPAHTIAVRNQAQTRGFTLLYDVMSRFLSLPGANAANLPDDFAGLKPNTPHNGPLGDNQGNMESPKAANPVPSATAALSTVLAKYPDMRQLASEKIRAVIKEKLHTELDPDKIFYHRFHSAVNDPLAFTGWRHAKQNLAESRSLTECVLQNFSADDQDNLDSVDMMGGLYNIDGQDATEFDARNEVKILPSQLAKLIWDMDFYQAYKQALETYWLDTQVQEVRNIYIFIETLKNSNPILTEDHKELLMKVFGLSRDNSTGIETRFFDINGYFATDMLVFQAEHASEVILYMPRVRRAIPFTTLKDLRIWIIANCVDDIHRASIAEHFAIAEREDGFFFDGVDSWLKTLDTDQTRDLAYICKKNHPITGKISQAILQKQKQRDFEDSKRLIKSDSDVRLQMAVEYISVINFLLPNPVTPFISLALDLDLAMYSDTQEERKEALGRMAGDLITLSFMALTEVGIKKLGYATGRPTGIHAAAQPEDIETMMLQSMDRAKQFLNTPYAGMYLRQSGVLEEDLFIFAKNEQNIIIHPEIMAVIKKFNIAEQTLDFTTSLVWDENGVIIGHDGQHYLQINNKYYQIEEDILHKRYHFSKDKNVKIFLDDGYEPKTFFLHEDDRSIFDDFSLSCRNRRAPTALVPSCPGFSESLSIKLAGMDSGVNESMANSIEPHPEIPYLFKSTTSDSIFIKFGDKYFLAKTNAKNDLIVIYKKCEEPSLQCIRGSMVKGPTLFYSKNTNKFYPNNKIGRLQEKSGFSYSLAKLNLFCQGEAFQPLTRNEIMVLQRYASNDYDAINEFMRAGMPERWMNGYFREHLYESINAIESSLSKIPAYKETVYRGLVLPAEDFRRLKVNDLLHSLSFVSTSADIDVARTFAIKTVEAKEEILYEIKIRTSGHPIALYTSRMREAEVLIDKDSWFFIEKIEGHHFFLNEIKQKRIDQFRLDNPTSMTYTL